MDKGGINIDKSRKLLLYSSAGLIALIFSLTFYLNLCPQFILSSSLNISTGPCI